ncbi:MAG: manganese efflux pump [Bacilli bacterium]|nr:manganese efflux pump [Bacilli bacterium]
MEIYEIIGISLGLAMDAFAASVCKGLSIKKIDWKKIIIIVLYFSVFQALMPVLGYFFGTTFSSFVEKVDHYIVFILLLIIGGKMIYDAILNKKDKKSDGINFKEMFLLAIATSIDALAVGVTFAFLEINLLLAITIIGIITFILSGIGVVIGNKFGGKYQNKAKLAGGIILILIGLKILLQHLGILPF